MKIIDFAKDKKVSMAVAIKLDDSNAVAESIFEFCKKRAKDTGYVRPHVVDWFESAVGYWSSNWVEQDIVWRWIVSTEEGKKLALRVFSLLEPLYIDDRLQMEHVFKIPME